MTWFVGFLLGVAGFAPSMLNLLLEVLACSSQSPLFK
jgi:hypothetical protein